jgi:tungstate transport system ATP-binding protein
VSWFGSRDDMEPTADRHFLAAHNLKFERGGTTILNVPQLSLNRGEVLSLIGPNGAGKTTLLQTLCYLNHPFSGEIIFEGLTVGKNCTGSEYRRRVAMVFQESLLFNTTVFRNVSSGLAFRHMRKDEIESRVTRSLHRFGIIHLKDRSARTLSGGEAQRTSLARAFATEPDVIFLDEPFASLDPPTRQGLMEDLEGVLRQAKTTTVLATHDREEALRLSDRIACMNGGKIVQIDRPVEIMNHPVDAFVASFVGVETVLSGQVAGSDGQGSSIVSVSGRDIHVAQMLQPGESVVICVTPESVVLSEQPSDTITSARNVFRGTTVRTLAFGPIHKVYIDCGFPLAAFVTTESLRNLSLREGKDITASFKATAIRVISRKH